MAEFLKNRRNALVITAVVVVLSIVMSFLVSAVKVEYEPISTNAATKWAKKNYKEYRQFVVDEADILSSDAKKTAAKYIAQLDYSNDSIIGVLTVKRLNGASAGEAAGVRFAKAPFSQCDGLLLIDAETGAWYAVFSKEFAPYAADGLQTVFEKMLGSSIDTEKTGRTVTELLRQLPQWYEEHYPFTQTFTEKQKLGGVLKPAAIIAIVIVVLLDLFGGKRK